MNKTYLDVLDEFMNMSIYSTDEVFDKFLTDKAGKMHKVGGHKFYFKPGYRNDRILIVAHADTVWDTRYDLLNNQKAKFNNLPKKSKTLVQSRNSYYSTGLDGIGVDDRAGVAIAWILKDTGNSILITDEEEIGAQTSRAIMRNEDLAELIGSHRYILQLDLSGAKEFKCYGAGSEDFKTMMEFTTHYRMRPNYSYTDVKFLGEKICGANLSIGYFDEHTKDEILDKKTWLQSLKVAKKLANQKHQQFYVDPMFGEKYSLKNVIEDNDLEIINQDQPGDDFEHGLE